MTEEEKKSPAEEVEVKYPTKNKDKKTHVLKEIDLYSPSPSPTLLMIRRRALKKKQKTEWSQLKVSIPASILYGAYMGVVTGKPEITAIFTLCGIGLAVHSTIRGD